MHSKCLDDQATANSTALCQAGSIGHWCWQAGWIHSSLSSRRRRGPKKEGRRNPAKAPRGSLAASKKEARLAGSPRRKLDLQAPPCGLRYGVVVAPSLLDEAAFQAFHAMSGTPRSYGASPRRPVNTPWTPARCMQEPHATPNRVTTFAPDRRLHFMPSVSTFGGYLIFSSNALAAISMC